MVSVGGNALRSASCQTIRRSESPNVRAVQSSPLEDVEHRGARHPRHQPGRVGGQRQRRQDEMRRGDAQPRPVAVDEGVERREARHVRDRVQHRSLEAEPARRGQQPELAAEQHLQEQPEPEDRGSRSRRPSRSGSGCQARGRGAGTASTPSGIPTTSASTIALDDQLQRRRQPGEDPAREAPSSPASCPSRPRPGCVGTSRTGRAAAGRGRAASSRARSRPAGRAARCRSRPGSTARPWRAGT